MNPAICMSTLAILCMGLWFSAPIAENPLFEYGTPLGIAVLLMVLWREDRKGRERQQRVSDDRYAHLVEEIMAKQGEALGEILAALGSRTSCPLVKAERAYRDRLAHHEPVAAPADPADDDE